MSPKTQEKVFKSRKSLTWRRSKLKKRCWSLVCTVRFCFCHSVLFIIMGVFCAAVVFMYLDSQVPYVPMIDPDSVQTGNVANVNTDLLDSLHNTNPSNVVDIVKGAD